MPLSDILRSLRPIMIGFLALAFVDIASAQTTKIDTALVEQLITLSKSDKKRVIVEYRIPTSRAQAMRPGASDNERRSAVIDGRNLVFNSMSPSVIPASRQTSGLQRALKYTPHFAFEGTKAEIDAFAENPNVVRIYEDHTVVPFLLPESTGSLLVDSVTTRSLGFNGNGYAVAIIDTGVAKTHTFIGPNRVVLEACYASDCPFEQGSGAAETPIGGSFHGTHVAGIAAGFSTLALSGVAPEADIISVRVFPVVGNANFSDVSAGLEFVYENRNNLDIAAVNMSLGLAGQPMAQSCDGFNQAVTDSINLLNDVGIAVVVASGNDVSSTGISFPACVSTAISVGATNDGSIENPLCTASGVDTSSFDEVSTYSNSNELIDLLAPGSNIQSSWGTNSEICNLRGTSMAAPHVTGAFAVLKAEHPNVPNDQILTALQTTGRPITDARNGIEKSRINVYEALLELNVSSSPATAFTIVPLNGFTLIPVSSP